MTKTKVLIAALAACSALVAVESSAASKADEGVKQTFAQLDKCVANNDAKCVGELMAEDATLLPAAGGGIVKGRAAIVASVQKAMGGPAPNMTGAKLTHVVENVRPIGDDRALVDCAVSVSGEERGGAYHAVALMVLKGDKWYFEDLRTYVVDTRPAAEKNPTPGPQAPANPPTPPADAPTPAEKS
ncbi:SgcJ/EcaC family oxidoreductase [bacterium]|nr:SgcJ/EcaC family oxidoreductase [bacterium]